MTTRYFVYQGNKYELIGVGKMNHPVSRQWVDAVIYKKRHTDDFYSRELEDFKSKFTEECGCGKFKQCSDNLNTCPIL